MALDGVKFEKMNKWCIGSSNEQLENDEPMLSFKFQSYENGSTLGDIGISSGSTSSAIGFP